jgi:hypothetical protein
MLCIHGTARATKEESKNLVEGFAAGSVAVGFVEDFARVSIPEGYPCSRVLRSQRRESAPCRFQVPEAF